MKKDLKAMKLDELLAEHRRLVDLPSYCDSSNEIHYEAVLTEINRREREMAEAIS